MARGMNHVGSFDGSAVQDLIDGDSFQGPIAQLAGSADVINPHASGNYMVTKAGVDAMTITAPTAGSDDGLSIAIFSDTTNAHTLTAATACFANGAALATVVTFKAFRGSGLQLRAWNGTWQVVSSNVTSIA